MMKLGMISGYDKEDFAKVKAKDLDFVEFCINFQDDDKNEDFSAQAGRIAEDLNSLGLFTGSVGRWGSFKILSDGSANPKEIEVDTRLIKAAKTLGCPIYVTNCNYVEELSLFENYQAAISYFAKLIEIGKEHGIKIATNNCHWNNYLTCDPAWSVVHGHLKDLYIKFDPSHCIYAGGNYLSEIKKWGNRFVHVHIKGSLVIDGERFDDPPAGLDQTNWGAFMAALYAVGYSGNLSIEPHSATWQGELGDKGVDYTINTIRPMMF